MAQLRWKRRVTLAGALLLPLAAVGVGAASTPAVAASPGHPSAANGRKLEIGFFEQWSIYARGYSLAAADQAGQIRELTDVDYAFGGVLPAGGKGTSPDPATNPVTCQSVDPWADYQTPYLNSVDGPGTQTGAEGLAGNFQQLKELKAKYPDLRVLMSLGGYTGSKYFSDAAATPQSRQEFVASCIDLFIKGNLTGWPLTGPDAGAGIFDGFDLDWEYPGNNNGAAGNDYSAADTENYTLLMQEFRSQLNALGRRTGEHYTLAAEMPAGTQNAQDIQVGALASYADYEVVMDYDFQGPWTPTGPTNFESNLYTSPNAPTANGEPVISVAKTVEYYERRGVAADQLIVGMPYYGHGWTGVPAGDQAGLYETATGPAASPDLTEQGTPFAGLDGGDPSGTTDYYEIAQQPGYEWHFDPATGATWLYNPTTQTFWSMENRHEVFDKALFIDEHGLAGASMWALEGDPGNTLTSALAAGLALRAGPHR